MDVMEIEMKLDSISYRGVAVEDLDFTIFSEVFKGMPT